MWTFIFSSLEHINLRAKYKTACLQNYREPAISKEQPPQYLFSILKKLRGQIEGPKNTHSSQPTAQQNASPLQDIGFLPTQSVSKTQTGNPPKKPMVLFHSQLLLEHLYTKELAKQTMPPGR